MSNTSPPNIEDCITIVIQKIAKAQTEVATYTAILEQLYRAQEADDSLENGKQQKRTKAEETEPLRSDPIDSFETIEFDEHQAPISQEYQQYLLAREKQEEERAARERRENATRIKYLSNKLEELQAHETKVQQEPDNRDSKLPAKYYQPPGWKASNEKTERFRQARQQAQQWAEQRKPNPHVWCSPANQKAIKERKEKVIKLHQVENRQAQYNAKRAATAKAKAIKKAQQLDSIIEEFHRAQQRTDGSPTLDEPTAFEYQDTDSGEGDY